MLVLTALYHLKSIVKLMFKWATTYILFVKSVKQNGSSLNIRLCWKYLEDLAYFITMMQKIWRS